jgi:hypothetical protein
MVFCVVDRKSIHFSNSPDGCEYPFLVRLFRRTKKDTANQLENG